MTLERAIEQYLVNLKVLLRLNNSTHRHSIRDAITCEKLEKLTRCLLIKAFL